MTFASVFPRVVTRTRAYIRMPVLLFFSFLIVLVGATAHRESGDGVDASLSSCTRQRPAFLLSLPLSLSLFNDLCPLARLSLKALTVLPMSLIICRPSSLRYLWVLLKKKKNCERPWKPANQNRPVGECHTIDHRSRSETNKKTSIRIVAAMDRPRGNGYSI